MSHVYTELAWLRRAPDTFSKQLKAAVNSGESLGRDFWHLASYALDVNQLTNLGKAVLQAHEQGKSLQPLVPFKLAILSNSTIDHLVLPLIATACRHGIHLEIVHPPYDQVAQEAFTPDSLTNRSRPDAVLFALDFRGLPLKLAVGDADKAEAIANGSLGYLQSLRNGIKAGSNAVCIFQNFVPPAERLFGSLDVVLPGTIASLLDRINLDLAAWVRQSGDVLLDINGLASTVGTANWHDPQLWNMAKFAFSDQLVPLYADHVSRIVAALRGKSRKVLVLDLDNTVWGGVIGDDGLDGIKVSQGDATGEAHLAVQRLALDLRSRGVVLAVSSKNTDEIARTPFLSHPEMLLKLDHIAVFQANWEDKATNIRTIAAELNVGVDSVVFLDDNPVERGLLRRLLPEVAVPELPEEPALYARTLTAAGYFEAPAFAAEDLKRADFYQDNAKRAELQKQVGGVDAYLASLDMTITFRPFDTIGRARIVQLINKSNQYNLTTRRYTEPEVAQMQSDPSYWTLQVRLQDVFGDNGMIAVVICRAISPEAWEIDTWLMSCRVLGRGVEHMSLRELLHHARAAGVKKLKAVYYPTEKNKLVLDHYSKLGFTKTEEEENGATHWEFDMDGPVPEERPMLVISEGFQEQWQESIG